MKGGVRVACLVGAVAACAGGFVCVAAAQAPLPAGGPPEGIDEVLRVARDASPLWIERLMPFAWRLFLVLAGAELTLKLGRAIFSGELTTVTETIVFFVIRKGLWAFVLLSAKSLMPAIVLSLQQAGSTAASHLGGGIEPQRIINGLSELARVQTEGMGAFNPIRAVEVVFALLLVFVSFGLCAAFAWLAWFRAYIVLGAGSIMLGFAGLTHTEGFAKRYFQYAVSAGIHLLVLELLKGLFFTYLDRWIVWAQADTAFGFQTALGMLMSALAMLVALISIPGFCAGIAHGHLSFAADAATMAATWKALSTATSALAGLPGKMDEMVCRVVEAFKSTGAADRAAPPSVSAVDVSAGNAEVSIPSLESASPFPRLASHGDDAPRLSSGGPPPPVLGPGDGPTSPDGPGSSGSGGDGGDPHGGPGADHRPHTLLLDGATGPITSFIDTPAGTARRDDE